MKILIVEDDYLFAEDMRQDILSNPKFSGAQVDMVCTEQEFREKFEAIKQAQYDLFILDVMIRWEEPSPTQKPPAEDVLEEGYFRAGIRCLQKLRSDKATEHVPVVIHSNLDDKEIRDEMDRRKLNGVSQIVAKSGSPRELMDALEKATGSAGPLPRQ